MSHSEPAATFRLRLLGPPQMERDGHPVKVDTRKAIALVAYLAMTSQAQRREALAALLWPEYSQERAHANLRRTLWSLNKALGSSWLDVDGEAIALRRGPGFWLDVDAFRGHLSACRTHGHPEADVCPTCLPALQAAVTLYRGDFPAGFTLRDSPGFDEWQFFQAEALRDELASALERLVRCHIAQDECEPAIPYARRWLALDPLQEAAHRQLMRLYAWAGQRAAALRQYTECVRVLEDELGIPPDAETRQLEQAIRAYQLPPPSVPSEPGAALPERAEPAAPPPVRQPAVDVTGNLPVLLTPFVGRKDELAEIVTLLQEPDCRLLTLVGSGGIGKTRLAIQAAIQAASAPSGAYRHGVHFAPLAPLDSVELLVPAIADALDFSFFQREDENPRLQLLNHLREKQMLLVLDNFEHLVQGAGLLAEILSTAPHVRLLVTSRERLNLHGEWVLEVRGMRFPGELAVESLEDYSAVQLFLQNAGQVDVRFSPSDHDIPHLIRICQLVEGVPLGIELAAAWIRMLSCREIAQEIEHGLDFLSTPMRDAPERHRSLRAVFDHSWHLLSKAQQDAFSKLSVFRGGFRREAAEHVAGADLALLSALMDKSLLRRSASGRYQIHEVLRQYAAEKLAEVSAEERSARDRHSSYFVAYLQQRESALKGTGQMQALDEIGQEIEDIRSAWQWAASQDRVTELRPAMGSLFMFCDTQSRFQEGAEAFAQAVSALEARAAEADEPGAESSLALGLALTFLGWFEDRLYHPERAAALLRRSLGVLRPLGPNWDLAMANSLAVSIGAVEDAEAETLLRESVALFEQAGDRWGIAVTLLILAGAVCYARTEIDECRKHTQESLALFREIGDRWGTAFALFYLGELAQQKGAHQEAKQYFQDSLEMRRELGDGWGAAYCLDCMGYLARRLGQYAEAQQLHHESLAVSREIGDRLGIAGSIDNLGLVAFDQGDYDQARHHFEEGLALRTEVGRSGDIVSSVRHLADLDLVLGDHQRATQRYQDCLETYEDLGSHWGIAMSHKGLGNVALAVGDEQTARQHLCVAWRIAQQSKLVAVSLDIMMGLAQLLALSGQQRRSAELLGFILNHPATRWQTQQGAKRLLAGLASPPSAEATDAARPVYTGATVEETADGLLAEICGP